jgi:flagellar biosynthesis/type III secretory pathway chaperone
MDMQNLSNDVAHMLAAMQAFSGVLHAETIALQARDMNTVTQLFPQKREFAQLYHDAMLRLDDQRTDLKKLDQSLKSKLKGAYAHFDEIVRQNRTALTSAKAVAERIVDLVMDAARRTVMDGPSYNRAGSNALSSDTPVHYKLNEVL